MIITDKDITQKALEILPFLNTAIKNIRLYPQASAPVTGAIEKLYQSLSNLFDLEESIFFTESEKSLLICGKSLMQKDQEKYLTLALLNVLLGLGIRSISFRRGLEKEEMGRFIGLLARNPESIQNDGGMSKLISDMNIVHAEVDQKVFVAMDKGHQILANIDTTNDSITRFFMLSQPDMDPSSPHFHTMTQSPQAMSKAFEAGLSKVLSQKESLSDVQLSSNLDNLLTLLDNVAERLDDENMDILSRQITQALLAADPVVTEQLASQNIQHLLGGHLYRHLTSELTQNKLDTAHDVAADESQNKLLQVAEKFGVRLQDSRTLLDEGLMAYLPKIIEQLVAQKQQESMERLLERLAANLANEKSDIRIRAARSLADILERLPGPQRTIIVEKLSDKLITWIRNEDIFSPEYQRIGTILKNVTQDFITRKQFSDALRYLDAFHAVAGNTQKPDAAKRFCFDLIDQLASPHNIDLLINEINSPESSRREDAARLFAGLGNHAVEDLLDKLRTQTDSNERVRTMHLIVSLKDKALPFINEQINRKAPWFYLRNLAYLLGQIGTEDSARALAPLLAHGNDKLRMEALKSIYKIGGDQRGPILLAALQGADDDFKSDIVETLGQSKFQEAVPVLIEMLKTRPLIATTARTHLEEKICVALGSIGSTDAIDPLSEIMSTKFLSLRAYPDRVKAAAATALVTLKRKAAQSADT